jgi:hypothetical protein
MFTGRIERRLHDEFPRCAFSPQAFGSRGAVSCLKIGNLRNNSSVTRTSAIGSDRSRRIRGTP